MGAETPNQVATVAQAVFLSYASQDADAARRICDALRAAGIEVWFDQSELRGGDVWDQKIRREIRDCALFIPVISMNTASRREGYFRLEWDLADQRSHRMARDQAFIVPVCLDATPGAGTDVPESFHRVQWIRLPNGETPPEFVAHIKRLLSPEPPTTARLPAGAVSAASPIPRTTRRSLPLRRALFVAVALLVLAALAYLLINKPWISKPAAAVVTPNAISFPGAPPAAFNPPPHSIAVLPFVNMSGDKDQEYFSEGLTEELLNSLSRISELQVAARTSSFSFQGEHPDISTVAHKLNVGAVLEGSVRRSAHTVRITAQLVNGVTGFHLWSGTYDRDLGDVLKLQTDIATAVASALKVTLLGDEASKIELGGTRSPAAFDAYLRGSKAFRSGQGDSSLQSAIAAYTEAIRLDPNYALALADRSRALSAYAGGGGLPNGTAVRELFDKAQADARKAIKLAPELAEGHLALAFFLVFGSLDFTGASEAYERAMALGPGNAAVLAEGGVFSVYTGRIDAGLAATRRAVVLDPLNPRSHDRLGEALYWARRYKDAAAALGQAISLESDFQRAYGYRGLAYYGLGDLQSALSSCEAKAGHWVSQWCLAVAYEKLGRHADAQAELTKMQAALGDTGPYQYATIYAQWGNAVRALEWLATAVRVRDAGVAYVKADPLLDPLRNEPRFQAIQRELKFPK
jgi:TolB-like protein